MSSGEKLIANRLLEYGSPIVFMLRYSHLKSISHQKYLRLHQFNPFLGVNSPNRYEENLAPCQLLSRECLEENRPDEKIPFQTVGFARVSPGGFKRAYR